MTFRRDIVGEAEIKAGLSALSDSVAGRLRRRGKKCTVVQVAIKSPDFRTIQRQCTLERATDLQKTITEAAFSLVSKCWNFNSPVRLLSVSTSGLVDAGDEYVQYSLFDNGKQPDEKQSKIEETLDEIRKKYGSGAIRFGHFKNEDTGIK